MRMIKKHIENRALNFNAEELLRYAAEDSDPTKSLMDSEAERSLLKIIEDNLSELENKVFGMYASGMSASEMAERLDISEKSVSNTVYRIRKKLKAILKK